MASRYPEIETQEMIVDNACMQLVMNPQQFDVIVSNPPYIPISAKKGLDKNVADFEPGIALFVGDDDPFIFYVKISAFAKHHLKPSGKIFVEVNEEYAGEVRSVFDRDGFSTRIKKDIYGKDRMISAVFKDYLPRPK